MNLQDASRENAVGLRQILLALAIFLLLGFLLLAVTFPRWIDGTGPYRNTTSLADLDGDGDLDVLLNNLRFENETTLWAGNTQWINQGGGRFTPVDAYNLLGENAHPFIAGSDVDSDGDTDLLAVANNRLVPLINQAGQYQAGAGIVPAGVFSQFSALTLGDLNGDGAVDGFVSGCCGMAFPPEYGGDGYDAPSSFVWIHQWNSGGWLERISLPVMDIYNLPVRGAALGDVDGDGDLDLFAAIQHGIKGQKTSPADRVLINDGSGNLSDSGQMLGQSDSFAVALGDVDADGDLDALVGTSSGASVWTNQGGIFALLGGGLPGGEGRAVFLNDLDGDGDLDALVAGKSEAFTWRNDGAGNFQRANQRLRYSERHGLALADFNGDGSADFFAGAYAETYSLWLNNGQGVFRKKSY